MLLSLPIIRLQVFCWNWEQNSQKLNSHQNTKQHISILLLKFISLLNSLNLYSLDSLEEMLIYDFGFVLV